MKRSICSLWNPPGEKLQTRCHLSGVIICTRLLQAGQRLKGELLHRKNYISYYTALSMKQQETFVTSRRTVWQGRNRPTARRVLRQLGGGRSFGPKKKGSSVISRDPRLRGEWLWLRYAVTQWRPPEELPEDDEAEEPAPLEALPPPLWPLESPLNPPPPCPLPSKLLLPGEAVDPSFRVEYPVLTAPEAPLASLSLPPSGPEGLRGRWGRRGFSGGW
jgi:hypothetical protein